MAWVANEVTSRGPKKRSLTTIRLIIKLLCLLQSTKYVLSNKEQLTFIFFKNVKVPKARTFLGLKLVQPMVQ